jgi:nucleoside-diphosphate-sugar epimerase
MEGKKILITGASGQCGRGLAFVLAKQNEVHALARFSKPEVKEELARLGCVTWQMDMGTERPTKLPTDFDVVFHEAVSWVGDDDLAVQNQSLHLSCQFVGDLMYRNEKARFALMSTGSVYQVIDGACKEDETPVMPHGTYCLAKVCMTQVARWIGHTFGRPWVVMRYYFPFAPYSPHPKVDRALQGRMMGRNPAACAQRTYIKNHLDNTIKALQYAKPEGEIFNSATTEKLTAADLAKIGARVAGVPVDPRALEPGEPEGPRHEADVTKLLRLIGPSSISLEEGFRRYLRARRENVLTPQDWMFEEERQ